MIWHSRLRDGRDRFPSWIGVSLAMIAAFTPGCANSARQVAREATPGGVEGAIQSLSEPSNQEKFNRIAGDATRQVSHNAVLGAWGALRELDVISADGTFTGKPLTRGDGSFWHRLGLTGVIAIALGLAVLGLTIAMLIILSRAHKARDQARRHEADTRRIKDVLRATGDRPWAKELEGLIEDKPEPESQYSSPRLRPGQPGKHETSTA